MPEQNVDQLWELVNVRRPQPGAKACQPGITIDLELGAVDLVASIKFALLPMGILDHCAKLQAWEVLPVPSLPPMDEEHRSRRFQLDQDRYKAEHR